MKKSRFFLFSVFLHEICPVVAPGDRVEAEKLFRPESDSRVENTVRSDRLLRAGATIGAADLSARSSFYLSGEQRGKTMAPHERDPEEDTYFG